MSQAIRLLIGTFPHEPPCTSTTPELTIDPIPTPFKLYEHIWFEARLRGLPAVSKLKVTAGYLLYRPRHGVLGEHSTPMPVEVVLDGGRGMRMVELFPGHTLMMRSAGGYNILLWVEWLAVETGETGVHFETTGVFRVEDGVDDGQGVRCGLALSSCSILSRDI
ncbi:hypothetical protein B0T16DRAFT_460209 [Cercophora newfieldiana]|uniref:Uncharacterized protein n=1 Tax=Cercophora newfieldiana TaxID=92897 RepID=A0AA40CNS1_9PEZI|nr:hypothetical protein B0T16DRAFT_460209 [Cercophora newfieldiana]